jgi:SAM-dependent methyltransferase
MKLLKFIYKIFIRLSKIISRKGIYPFLNIEFKKISSSKKVLTIGAGGEVNLLLNQYSKKNSFDLVSFDIEKKMMPDIMGDICTFDFKEEKYDYVVIVEVLEHLHSPHLAISNIKSILNKGGKIILTVPFIFPIHERPYDYYRFTKYGLEFLFKGFTNLKIKERNSWLEAINVLFVRLVMDRNLISRFLAPFFIILAYINLPFIWILSKVIRTDFITTGYLVTASKD